MRECGDLKMGRTSSKLISKPKNPLQEMQWQQTRREIIKEKLNKKQKQLLKKKEKFKKHNKKSIGNGMRNSKKITKKLRLSKCKKAQKILADDTEAIENYVRRQYENNLYGFITNQIAFSTEFYSNYERDIKQISDDLLCWENKINSTLENHSVLFTNILQSTNLNCLSHVEANKSLVTDDDDMPLQFQRIYIVFENIDIKQPNEANYDCISTLCKVNMETEIGKKYFHNFISMLDTKYVDVPRILYEAKWQGYLRLKLLGQRQEATRNYRENDNNNTTISSRSFSSITHTEYDYVYKEFKLLENPEADKDLPKNCVSNLLDFIEVKNKYQIHVVSQNDEDEEVKNQERHLIRLRDQLYLNSQHFMHYFGNLFRKQLATKLHITNEELENATYCAAAIYIRNYEVMPAIYVPQNAQNWPECAYKFKIRTRPLLNNYATGLKEQWPTRSMIKQIESFGCHLIPMGYAPKRQALNPLRTLEWCIVFPKAERYLLQQLTRTQVKVLLMTKLLLRTFCKSLAVQNIFTFLRTHLFWCCERNFATWPDELIGDVLVQFIKSFMQCLREKRLKDFFIEQRNLFENVPDHVLSQLHSILSDISTNPLMHLLIALKKTHYVKELFPKLQFSYIFILLTPKSSHKLLKKFQEIKLKNQKWCKRKLNIQQIKNDSQSAEINTIKENSLTAEECRHSIEDIRGAILLEVFLQQFLEMAAQAVEYNSLNLVTSLLDQARKLCVIYKGRKCIKNFCDYASIMDRIEQQTRELKADHQHTTLPSTPTMNNINNNVIKIDLNYDENADACLSYA